MRWPWATTWRGRTACRQAADVAASSPMRVLGLSFSGHGTAICLVEDGQIVAATNLERLTRVKFALATLPQAPYREALAAMLTDAFGYERMPPFADFYEVFPQMLESVCGETE